MSEVDAAAVVVKMPDANATQSLTNSSACSLDTPNDTVLENSIGTAVVSSNGSHSEALAKVDNIAKQQPVAAMEVDNVAAEVSSSTEDVEVESKSSVATAAAKAADSKQAEASLMDATAAADGVKAKEQQSNATESTEHISPAVQKNNDDDIEKDKVQFVADAAAATAAAANVEELVVPDTSTADSVSSNESKSSAAEIAEAERKNKTNDEVETKLVTNKQAANAVDSLAEAEAVAGKINSTAGVAQKENGVASKYERKEHDAGIVDLGDDTDDDVEVPKEPIFVAVAATATATATAAAAVTSNATNGKSSSQLTSNAAAASATAGSDSDVAFVIGSDSENEINTVNTVSSKTKTPAAKTTATAAAAAKVTVTSNKMPVQQIDDDDDDCVVIEDDVPALAVKSVTSNRNSAENAKRKAAVDTVNSLDDTQPPNKRPCNITAVNSNVTMGSTVTGNAGYKTRPLILQHPNKHRTGDADIYPVNITPATGNAVLQTGPPKLVPMTMPNNNSNLFSSLPCLSLNASQLPGLTDDMFVLEAPSFIVPYIYEKPPADNLKQVVKTIEEQFKLTKEDLAEMDNSDEFDMMTEQNKEDKTEENSTAAAAAGKKKKNRNQQNDADDSWSEDSEENDDFDEDDDSDMEVRTKILIKEANDDYTALKGAIKPAAALATSTVPGGAASTKPGMENYFESPLGKFFMDIGVGLVQEFVQYDLIRLQKRKMRKSLGKNTTELERAITALSGNLEASKKKNSPFKFTMKRCEFCNFKSESALAMANHYETPHMNGIMYKCNFCIYEIRNATEIVYHMEAVHNIKARLIKPLSYHQCPNCGFEDNGKAKLARHQPVCAKKYRPELNLAPPNDWEAPAKIPRIKPRHGLVGTATAYQAMAAQAAAQKAAMQQLQQQQLQAQQQQQAAMQARTAQAAALAAQNAAKARARTHAPAVPKPNILRGPVPVRNVPPLTNQLSSYPVGSPQFIQQQQQAAANAIAKKTLCGQPSISVIPLPRQNAASTASTVASTSKMPAAGIKPGQQNIAGAGPATGPGNKSQFVICEICDGYIKDLEQLRNHMHKVHNVKIHPKMIYNRPPLNCQKCQFRFFTDQGLERHLLGSHGLVTSSMQEAANKGKDAGRCPVCGRYQWKLLSHVSRDHHMTLKPAHLSYKCTVCTATFGMYKEFETHVYTAHSTVAKKAIDAKKSASTASASVGSSGSGGMSGGGGGGGGVVGGMTNSGSMNLSNNSQRGNALDHANHSLLTPLKINDEITIIPQPAAKSRISQMETHIID